MPALITHRLFGEAASQTLPAGIITSAEERCAFLIANQGPDPFFFRVRTPHFRDCMELASALHRSRMTRAFAALIGGVSHLPKGDAGIGRAFVLGLLGHYALDRRAHPFVYAQQWAVMGSDPDLEGAGNKVHAVIESDLDIIMLALKRDGATVAECPPVCELASTDRVDRVGGALMSHVAHSVYGLSVNSAEYGGAVADMQLVYSLIEPAESARTRLIAGIESLAGRYSLLGALAHPVGRAVPDEAANLAHNTWHDPFTHAAHTESFPEIFEAAVAEYARLAALLIETGDAAAVTEHINYAGRILGPDEECLEDD